MGERLPSMFANVDDRIAKPGDPDLDMHLTGLRIASVVTLDTDGMTEFTVTFATGEAAGFWIDTGTGERVYPDQVTSVDLAAGLAMRPGAGWLLNFMLRRLEAWRADAALVAMTGAPGKWTLLYCPRHPAGEIVPVPRTGPAGEGKTDAQG
jgi:hypothetical protein